MEVLSSLLHRPELGRLVRNQRADLLQLASGQFQADDCPPLLPNTRVFS